MLGLEVVWQGPAVPALWAPCSILQPRVHPDQALGDGG